MKKLTSIALLIAALCTTSFAGTPAKISSKETSVLETSNTYFQKGDVLVDFSGSYTFANISTAHDNIDLQIATLQAGASYFVCNNVAVGADVLGLFVPKADIGSGAKGWLGGAELKADYFFQFSKTFIPYAGVHGGIAYGYVSFGEDESDHVLLYGAHAGFVVPIKENVYFDTQFRFTQFDEFAGANLNATQILLGLKIKL